MGKGCKGTLAKTLMKNLDEKERERVQVLFISVDPNRNTLQQLKSYVTFFYPTFAGLTGNPKIKLLYSPVKLDPKK